MATLAELSGADVIHRIDDDQWGFVPIRLVYAAPRLMEWLTETLPGMTGRIALSPLEQVTALLEDFCSGEPLVVGPQFNSLDAVRNESLWKLKTPETRIFGWFAQRDVFVGVSGHSADHVKKHNLYPGVAAEASRFRDLLDLDEPKFIEGDEPYGVVSNYSFP